MIRNYASYDVHVLILGPTGTGKGLVAGAIHELSPRASKPFVHINCGALRPELCANELFGHERGAYSGQPSGTKENWSRRMAASPSSTSSTRSRSTSSRSSCYFWTKGSSAGRVTATRATPMWGSLPPRIGKIELGTMSRGVRVEKGGIWIRHQIPPGRSI